MDRREFVSGVALGLLAAPLTAEAQPERNVPKIGLIMLSAPGTEWRPAASGPFWERLRELGWVEGQNIVVERRGAGGDWDRIPSLAGELAQLKVAVILVGTGAEARRTQQGTRTVPICAAAGDLQAEGLVANLAKPEGNVTGVQVVQADLVGKRLSLLKDAVPGLTRVGVLIGGRSPTTIAVLRNAEEAGRRMGLELHVVEGRSPQDFERVFSVLTKEHASGLLVMHSPATSTNVGQIVALAAKSRLVAIYEFRSWAEAGGFMSYGSTSSEFSRQWAECVDKILRGAKPGDVPVQQPTKFELVINIKTARALGITIPPSLLLRADQVIE